jgi:hypothetical protein
MEIGQQYVPYNLFNSIFIPDGLLSRRELTVTAKVVWATLNKYAGRRGIAWPSISEIAGDCAVSNRAVSYALEELESRKLIQRAGMHRKRVLWVFLWHEWLECSVKNARRFGDHAKSADIHEENHAEIASSTTLSTTNQAELIDNHAKSAPSTMQNLHPNHAEIAPVYNKVPSGSCTGSCNGSSSMSAGGSQPPRPPGDDDRENPRYLLGILFVPGRPDFADYQELDYIIADHGQEPVTKYLREASARKIRRGRVLPYVRQCLKNETKEDAESDGNGANDQYGRTGLQKYGK